MPSINLPEPTVRAKARVAIELPSAGKPTIEAGDAVRPGDVIGTVGTQKIVTPVGGRLTWLVDARSSEALPRNYPVATVLVEGFSVVSGSAKSVPTAMRTGPVSGRVQVSIGVGASPILECLGVGFLPPGVAPDGIQSSEAGSSDTAVVCQLPATVDVLAGDAARMVLTSSARRSVPAIPISAVVGRGTRGQVAMEDGSVRDIGLGAVDGQNVEVISGLVPGDRIRATPPDLSPVSP